MSTRTRASVAGPLLTFTPGISRRKCCTSPLPRSSTPTNSLIGSSAGTSSMKRRVASSIRALASSAMWPAPFREVTGGAALDLMTLQQLAPDNHALDLGDAHAARGHVDAADLERVHHLREALVEAGGLGAEDVLRGAAVAVEHELGGLDSLVAELLDLGRDAQAGEVARVLARAGLFFGDE